MATNVKSDIPTSPRNDESEPDPDAEENEDLDEEELPETEEPVDIKQSTPVSNNFQDILKRLQSSGALLKKPKQEHRCLTCDKDFPDWEDLENHLIQHVSLPSVVLDKLPSDEEDNAPSGDDWSDEEEDAPPPQDKTPQKTPQKIDISQIIKKTGISIKKPGQSDPKSNTNANSALSKLSGLGFTIKKNSTPVKQETTDKSESSQEKLNPSDVMQKLGKLGGIKLKLKSDGANTNSFKVINGLKDFKTSDDEDEDNDAEKEDDKGEDSGNEEQERGDKGDEGEESGDEQEQAPDPEPEKQSDEEEDDEEEIPLATRKINNAIKNAMKKKLETPQKVKTEKPESVKKPEPVKAPAKPTPPTKPPGRPAVKQTPRRGANHPLAAKQAQTAQPTQGMDISTTSSTPERRESSSEAVSENVVVKKEVETGGNEAPSSTMPLFSGQIKTERTSPPPSDATPMSTPIIAKVKTETEPVASDTKQEPLFQRNNNTSVSQSSTTATTPLLPVTKTEEMTVIEINGDSDGDDDCCVVSATPAPDVKPIIPKPETLPASYSAPAYSSSQPSFTSAPVLSSRLSGQSTEKQHNFNWNAPDSKPPLDMLEKSTDELFDSFMAAKRENPSLISDAEYISLDTLGPQHSCEVCNTRFTSLSLLDDHRRMTGHSTSLVAPTSSTLLPYNPSSNILSSLLPVKQLADQVGKLSGMGGGPGFTHQQNVMINIQAYPGAAGGVMGPPGYNSYAGQGMHPGFQQTPNNLYTSGMPGQQMHGQMPGQMPGQYPGQNFMGQSGFGQQYQPHGSKPGGYPIPTSSPYSSASSPLQGMQQAIYGQSGMMNSQMGPPGSSYVPVSSPSVMKPPTSSGVRIQNVQTFPPGQFGTPGQQSGDLGAGQMGMGQPGQMGGHGQPQMAGQAIGNQMPTPGPIRMAAGANITGTRPRMPNVRGVRPTIRPGIQVHGQVRGAKPRMPMKRPAGAAGGPGIKRRNDMLLPGKHDNEDCQVMSMQKQREGLPMIQSVQGAKDKLNLGSQISITKKAAPNKQANAMANVLASRGISVKQKPKSRSPSPERPVPHIPNLGSGVSIKHTSKSSNFSIPEAKVGGNMNTCKICRKMFMNSNSLAAHMATVHPSSKVNVFKCDECPASYPKSLQLQHHKRVFHNVQGPNRELGLPVVDLSQEDNIKRLSNLGIYSFIPLANREQVGGCFGIPVISVHNMQNGITNGLQALGADGLLSLGPMKPLPNT